jgi:hypothetical protein
MKKLFGVVISVALLASCATMELVTQAEQPAMDAINQFDSLGITLMRMSQRGLIDLAIRTEGQRYWAQKEDPGFGTYGIVEYDIFSDWSIAQRTARDFQAYTQDTWIAYLTGQKEYTFDYGSLRGGVGSITNVAEDGTLFRASQQIDPIDIAVESYLIAPRQAEAAISEVVAAYDGDVFMAGTLRLSIGVIHVMTSADHRLTPGYFYLYSDSYADSWAIHDAGTGEPLFDATESPVDYPKIQLGFFMELPVDPDDFDALESFIESRGFDDYIKQAIDDAISREIYKLAPYGREFLQRVEE